MRRARPGAALETLVAENVGVSAGETLLAAVSGGPDSVALAALLADVARRADARVVLGHVNHGLRPTSWQDEAVVLALGAALHVRVVAVSLPEGPSDEARLREERYAALVGMARDLNAARIFTAHHVRDQAETVLLALFRGTGPAGLAGMPPVRTLAEGIVLQRPLLGVEPADLAAYRAARHLPYALDPSNADLGYRRNAVRAALEDLRSAFPHLDAAVARCASIARDERAGEPRAAARAELRAALEASVGTRDIPFERLDAAARALERGGRGRHFLRRGVELHIDGEK
jgi:tRNA(Ile)-lysidine synthetase-like protein